MVAGVGGGFKHWGVSAMCLDLLFLLCGYGGFNCARRTACRVHHFYVVFITRAGASGASMTSVTWDDMMDM